MATKAFSTLIPLVASSVTGCPPPQILNALRQAAKELCRDGWAWSEDLAAMNVVALQDAYTLTSPNVDGRIFTVLRVRHDNVDLRFREWDTLMGSRPDHPNTATPGTPTLWSLKDSQTLSLYAVPEANSTGGLKVRAVLVPTSSAAGIEQRVMDDYEEELVRGALYRLLIIPDKNWTDVKLADFYGRKFRSDVMACRARVNKGLAAHSKQVVFPRIA